MLRSNFAMPLILSEDAGLRVVERRNSVSRIFVPLIEKEVHVHIRR